jgi:hypothetical protein
MATHGSGSQADPHALGTGLGLRFFPRCRDGRRMGDGGAQPGWGLPWTNLNRHVCLPACLPVRPSGCIGIAVLCVCAEQQWFVLVRVERGIRRRGAFGGRDRRHRDRLAAGAAAGGDCVLTVATAARGRPADRCARIGVLSALPDFTAWVSLQQARITETNRTQLVLLGMQKWACGPYLDSHKRDPQYGDDTGNMPACGL